jgi:alcohol dehydrogenase (quinone), cytochrome c subunit
MTNRRNTKALAAALVFFLLAMLAAAYHVMATPDSIFDGDSSVSIPSAQLVEHGAYVARLADCVACHSTASGMPFAGGLEMKTPMGVIFSTNITPEKTTGIGNYTLADFDRALRHGIAQDGHRLYPAMPYPSYAKLTDEDVSALYAYVMHGIRPVREQNRKNDIPWPLGLRWPLAFWNVFFTNPAPYQARNIHGDDTQQWNRGAYIVQGPGHCGSCHTPRGTAMNERALDDSSPLFLSGAVLDGWFAPSLRNDPNAGLGRWSEDDVFQFLKNGRNDHAVAFGSMAEAFNNSTQFMTERDLRAIARYLKSLPGDSARDGAPWRYNAASNDELKLKNRASIRGAQTFMARCSYCHGVDGKGQGRWIPPLAGSASSMTAESASSINVVLNSSARVVASGIPDAYRMPPFRKQLSDQEIADVLTFVRTSWGNLGGAVDSATVADLRGRTRPANPNPVVLQTR